MQKFSFVIAALLLLAGCDQYGQNNAQAEAEKQWTAANQAAAPQQLTQAELDTCANAYRAKMNDPASFSYADNTGGQKIIGTVVGDGVLYTARIRGKNGFGGLVLNNMMCTFKYDAAAKKLTFVAAWD